MQERKVERLAQVMGIAKASEIGATIQVTTEQLGLPAGLSSLGVREDVFPRIVKGALADHCHNTNPRQASQDDYERMLSQSL